MNVDPSVLTYTLYPIKGIDIGEGADHEIIIDDEPAPLIAVSFRYTIIRFVGAEGTSPHKWRDVVKEESLPISFDATTLNK